MKKSNIVAMSFLSVLFISVIGMFYYQNFYLDHQQKKNLKTVFVVKKDMPMGSVFTEENVGVLQIEKERVFDNYITKADEILGKKSKATLYKNEIITKERVQEDGNEKEDGNFRLSVTSKEMPPNIKVDDTVRILVKPRKMSQLFEVVNAKDVEHVNVKVTSSGKETSHVLSLTILASNEEIELYQKAKSLGDIIIVPYEELSGTYMTSTLPFNEVAVLIQRIQEKANIEKKSKDAYFGQIHEVKLGDTWTSLANKYLTTSEELKGLNPSVHTLKEGVFIQVN